MEAGSDSDAFILAIDKAAQAGREAVERSRDAGHPQVYSWDNVLYFKSQDGLKEVIGFVGEARTIDDCKEPRSLGL